jgi:hypothetical protein
MCSPGRPCSFWRDGFPPLFIVFSIWISLVIWEARTPHTYGPYGAKTQKEARELWEKYGPPRKENHERLTHYYP